MTIFGWIYMMLNQILIEWKKQSDSPTDKEGCSFSVSKSSQEGITRVQRGVHFSVAYESRILTPIKCMVGWHVLLPFLKAVAMEWWRSESPMQTCIKNRFAFPPSYVSCSDFKVIFGRFDFLLHHKSNICFLNIGLHFAIVFLTTSPLLSLQWLTFH